MSRLWPPKIVHNAPYDQQSFQDFEALTVGENADAIVQAGTSSWNVHLKIMMIRSRWFEAKFQEALARGSNVVVVEGPPYLVYKAIVWIYTNTLEFHEPFKGPSSFTAGYELYDLASQLEMYNLMLACQERLKSYLRNLAVSLQRAKCSGQTPTLHVALLCDGIIFVCQKGHNELRDMFADFINDTHFWVLDVPDFGRRACQSTDFHKVILEMVKNRPGIRLYTPTACDKCGKNPFVLGGGGHYADIVKSADGKVISTCYFCFRKEQAASKAAA
ncbi:hypothetical protein F4811DRAFT_566946 [Daldinia bambusicola]|nr:hypothetical protein F4811DRAFT_566946 [Daldinia bambusicola]